MSIHKFVIYKNKIKVYNKKQSKLESRGIIQMYYKMDTKFKDYFGNNLKQILELK